MSTWSLSQLLADLHDEIQNRLATARQRFRHAGTKDDASERVRLELLQNYLSLYDGMGMFRRRPARSVGQERSLAPAGPVGGGDDHLAVIVQLFQPAGDIGGLVLNHGSGNSSLGAKIG
jgi:hypothetical protein